MELSWLLDRVGDSAAVALAGLAIGIVFGASAQRSQFCLRAAVVSFWRWRLDQRVAVWLLCFSTAVVWTQALNGQGLVELGEARWLSAPGSLSGAMIGGLIFGIGMVLARGCSGRLLVLAATGNLRALLSGLVFAVVAQMSMDGVLAPLRQSISGIWLTGATNIEVPTALGLGPQAGLVFGLVCALVALAVAFRAGVRPATLVWGSGVGFAVGAGWFITTQLAGQSFDPVPVESLTFSGPSADVLMFLLQPGEALDFDIGLVPGVAIGAAGAALLAGEWKLLGFEGALSMRRYLVGAALMGFGAMTAGGCAIGAGVTGGSAFALSAWVALTSMWLGGGIADALFDRAEDTAPAPAATPAE